MKKLTLSVLWIIVFAGTIIAGTIDPNLVAKLDQSEDDEFVRFFITMDTQSNLEWMDLATRGLTKQESRELVISYLSDLAESTQWDVRELLEDYEVAGKVKNLQSIWIVNALYGLATHEVIQALEKLPDNFVVTHDPEKNMLIDAPNSETPNRQTDDIDEIAWGVLDINADDVWALGYDGSGVIVAVIDTGVDYNHVDLADHMWDGGAEYPNHGWDFAYNDNDPMDVYGHGTHCAGSVASDGTAGSQCGVAPNASIMAVRVLNDGGIGTPGQMIAGINFSVAQGADVLSMSIRNWAIPVPEQFRTACNNALAAGVIGAAAAGNQGDYNPPVNIGSPGNVPPPWLHLDQTLIGGTSCVVTVGASDSGHNIADFSSCGPVTWENVSPWNDYPYANGSQMGLISPDVAAPGVEIKSLDVENTTGYTFHDGTSMATPYVAGALALMLSKNPNLTPVEMDSILETTSIDLGVPGKDNTWGSGLIDALAAVNAVPEPSGLYNVDLSLNATGSTSIPEAGGLLEFDVRVENGDTISHALVYWLDIIRPDGLVMDTMLTENLQLAVGDSITNSHSLAIPDTLPSGSYTLWARVGVTVGGTVYSEDSFVFSKDPVGIILEPVSDLIPGSFNLGQNYPNPFNPVTTIPLSLAEQGYVSLKVFDLQGSEMATLLEGELTAGHYNVTYDASSLSTGIYFYRLEAGDFSNTMKFVLVK